MSDITTIELCSHICARCGGCLGQCCPGHTREDQRDAWNATLAQRARGKRSQRGRPRQRVSPTVGMIRVQPRRTP